MKLPIYFDYAATTPMDPQVAEKMRDYLTLEGTFGNPASSHAFGHQAKKAVDLARAQIANLIHADPREIIWTSGTTEANNLALKGSAELYQRKGKHIITLKTEHASILDCCQQLEKKGFSVTYLNPEASGLINLSKLKEVLREDTFLISIAHVNNEIGIIQDIAAIAKVTSKQGILLHVDAAQSAGKVDINLQEMPVDLMSFSSHKIYGPKGVGALYVRRKPRIKVNAQIHGGGQEQGIRSGTLPVHQIVGMGEAFALAKKNKIADEKKLQNFKIFFIRELQKKLPFLRVNGDLQHTVYSILNLSFKGIPASVLIDLLPDLAISAGSACHAKGNEPSLVLRAIGLDRETSLSSVRFSFGRFTKEEEIKFAIDYIVERVQQFLQGGM